MYIKSQNTKIWPKNKKNIEICKNMLKNAGIRIHSVMKYIFAYFVYHENMIN